MLLVCLQRSVLEYYCIKNSYKVQGIRIYTSLLKWNMSFLIKMHIQILYLDIWDTYW